MQTKEFKQNVNLLIYIWVLLAHILIHMVISALYSFLAINCGILITGNNRKKIKYYVKFYDSSSTLFVFN